MSLLDDTQLAEIARIRARLDKFRDAATDLNQDVSNLAAFIGEPIRLLPVHFGVLPANDLSAIVFRHAQAVQQMRADAMDRITV